MPLELFSWSRWLARSKLNGGEWDVLGRLEPNK